MSSKYHKAFENSQKKAQRSHKRLPDGLKLRRSETSYFDKPIVHFFKYVFGILIGIGGFIALVLFIRSFSEETDRQHEASKDPNAYQRVEVRIGFKPESK